MFKSELLPFAPHLVLVAAEALYYFLVLFLSDEHCPPERSVLHEPCHKLVPVGPVQLLLLAGEYVVLLGNGLLYQIPVEIKIIPGLFVILPEIAPPTAPPDLRQ